MERYLCIHGHFYQPPRENPWLEAVEIQDSARPYHDWNERITAECYAPNSASRILDGEGRITEIISNYARMSFDFGPTLLSWMEVNAPAVYRAIIDADKESAEKRSGHGNAIAHAYNHMIMPLANSRDKRTQILWGIRDFEHRFGRFPEGMWLPEAAVDLETLRLLAEGGIKFTILSPHQAMKVRKAGSAKWKDISGGRIDPSMPYLCKFPGGRRITLFFYDGPIAHSVAFGKVLEKGEGFVARLFEGYSDARTWPQILNLATDGETFGHHHKYGDMSLAFALNEIEAKGLARLTNYGEHLEKNPPLHEVQIAESSSWSCIHGIERWRSDCGCNSGGHAGWSQGWREPLRDALDWLRDQLAFGFENKAKNYLKKPWSARDDYIEVVLDRSRDSLEAFLKRHAARKLREDERITVLKLLEIQRHAMLMYTSCGWFFDELSGLETVQVLQYAGRAVQLSSELFGPGLEDAFIGKLAAAKSNLKEHGDGGRIYKNFVTPSMLDLKKVGAHYAVSSLFEDYPDTTRIYAYSVKRQDRGDSSNARGTLSVGRISVSSEITGEWELLSYGVIHLGGHDLNCGIRTFLGDEQYRAMKDAMIGTFEGGAFSEILRLMDEHFGMHNYSLKDLFRDEQRRVLSAVIANTLEGLETTYRGIYRDNRHLMAYLRKTDVPIPRALLMAAEFTLNQELKKAFQAGPEIKRIHCTAAEAKQWVMAADEELELAARRRVEEHMEKLREDPSDPVLLGKAADLIGLLHSLPVAINFWHMQNIYHRIAKTAYPALYKRAKEGDRDAGKWTEEFRQMGRSLSFNIEAVLSGSVEGGPENG